MIPTLLYPLVAVATVAFAWTCIRSPRVGVAISILVFIPAPIFPEGNAAWLFYGFAGFLLLTLTGWLLQLAFHVRPFDRWQSGRIGLSLLLWLLLCVISMPVSLAVNEGTSLERLGYFGKGLVPFVYLLVYFVVRALPFRISDLKLFLKCLLAIAVVFAAITFGIYAVTHMRVTWIYFPLTFPFVVMGANVSFAKMLTVPSRLGAFNWGLLTAAFAVAIALTLTKAQIVALFASCMLIAVLLSLRAELKPAKRRAIAFLGISAIGFIAVAASLTQGNSFQELVTARLNDETSTGSRISEWDGALEQFRESPIIGKGIGFQLERDMGGETITSGYVHDQIAYVLMTTGIPGLIVYSLLIYNWFRLVLQWRTWHAETAVLMAVLHGCVVVISLFALAFATFRTIQHNFLLGILLGLIVRLTPTTGRKLREDSRSLLAVHA